MNTDPVMEKNNYVALDVKLEYLLDKGFKIQKVIKLEPTKHKHPVSGDVLNRQVTKIVFTLNEIQLEEEFVAGTPFEIIRRFAWIAKRGFKFLPEKQVYENEWQIIDPKVLYGDEFAEMAFNLDKHYKTVKAELN